MSDRLGSARAHTSEVALPPGAQLPDLLKQVLEDGEGCLKHNLLVAGTLCGHQALDELLSQEHVEGADRKTRLGALRQKHPAIPQLCLTVLGQLEDGSAGPDRPLSPQKLRLLMTTLKVAVYEIYVLGPEREQRIATVQRLLDAPESTGTTPRITHRPGVGVEASTPAAPPTLSAASSPPVAEHGAGNGRPVA